MLSERERFELDGPGGVRMHGMDREFTWYVRDGFFVRSPVKANGVAVGEAERTTFEQDWLEREKTTGAATPGEGGRGELAGPSVDTIRQR